MLPAELYWTPFQLLSTPCYEKPDIMRRRECTYSHWFSWR